MKFTEILGKAFSMRAYAMARSRTQDPLQGFMFRVSIDGIPSEVGFQSVSGLSREVEVVEYLESMYDHAHKLPGRESFGEITFARGMYPEDNYLRDAYEKCFQKGDDYRSEVTLTICDRAGTPRKYFGFAEAWFSSYTPGDLDSTSSDVVIENLVMQYEYMFDPSKGN